MSSSTALLPLIADERQFFLLRQKLLGQPTAKQTQVTNSVASVHGADDEPSVGPTQIRRGTETTIKRKTNKFESTLFVHCTHEGRLDGLKRYIHEIHNSLFMNTPNADIRLVVGHRNNPNIECELARKRPSSALLKDPSKTSTNRVLHVLSSST
jgi:hypothetical protein